MQSEMRLTLLTREGLLAICQHSPDVYWMHLVFCPTNFKKKKIYIVGDSPHKQLLLEKVYQFSFDFIGQVNFIDKRCIIKF